MGSTIKHLFIADPERAKWSCEVKLDWSMFSSLQRRRSCSATMNAGDQFIIDWTIHRRHGLVDSEYMPLTHRNSKAYIRYIHDSPMTIRVPVLRMSAIRMTHFLKEQNSEDVLITN